MKSGEMTSTVAMNLEKNAVVSEQEAGLMSLEMFEIILQ